MKSILGGVLLALAAAAADAKPAAGCDGGWGAGFQRLQSDSDDPVVVRSPNGRASVAQTEQGMSLERAGKTVVAPMRTYSPPLAYALWSPDSRRVAVNASDGGAVGTWFVTVFEFGDAGRVRALEVDEVVKRRLAGILRCEPLEETLNVAAVAWLDRAGTLLTIAQVPPHSSCRNLGAFKGVVVSIPSMEVRQVLDEAPLRRRFGRLLCAGAR